MAPIFTGSKFGFGRVDAAVGGGGSALFTFYMWGAGGGGRTDGSASNPTVSSGAGGYLEATSTTISPSDTLYVYVGNPGLSNSPESSGLTPFVFGGGSTQYGLYSGSGGGAAYVSLNGTAPGPGTLLLVAGGGGGISYSGGGNGGGPVGGTGNNYDGATGGGGGTQVAGGAGGSPDYGGSNGTPGSFLQGGNGAPGGSTPGGGGGGGYYGGGGGGGASTNSGGDGGGGSSYYNPTYMTIVTNTQGNYRNVTNPSPFIDPNWHSYGSYKVLDAGTRYYSSTPAKYGGRARVVLSNGTWFRTFNFQGAVESIPANYSPYGLDFTVSGSSPVDGPYDKGWGWGIASAPGGASTASIANSGSITYTFNFSGPNSNFTNFEIWTSNVNGLTSFTGSFNGGSPFSFPTATSSNSTPSGSLAPYLPGTNVTSFTITHGGGSGNSHIYVHAMKINGITVDFGRNLM